ncbi:MAG TPA: hypothetical protein DCM86_12445 [Verrucomicrobiales bacterium]|nr:hypothetical protein [Verrucomicrobiales bacterium]
MWRQESKDSPPFATPNAAPPSAAAWLPGPFPDTVPPETRGMRLLFIKLRHIGDALILTPTLTAVRAAYPTAEIWVVVRRGSEGILAGCTAIDQIRTTAPPERSGRGWRDFTRGLALVRELRERRFDWAFELSDGDRGRLLARLSGARQTAATSVNVPMNTLARWAIRRFDTHDWTPGHRVEKDHHTVSAFLPLGGEVPPMTFDPARRLPWGPGSSLTQFAVLHPGTRWRRKRWPAEGWISVGRALAGRGLQVVVSSGPDPEERAGAAALVAAIGNGTLSTDGQAGWTQLGWLLGRARLFVGVDTAAMHLAAACGCPVVGIFGPSVVSQWRPWRVPHQVITPPEGTTAENDPEGIRRVRATDVLEACSRLLDSPR